MDADSAPAAAVLDLQGEALDHFYNGQDLADAGDPAGSRKQLELAVAICESSEAAAQPWKSAPSPWQQLGVGPPFELIGSAALNCIGEQELDRAVADNGAVGGAVLSPRALRPAAQAFARAVRLWPENLAAKINLAHLAREQGRPALAVEHLTSCVAAIGAAGCGATGSGSDGEGEGGDDSDGSDDEEWEQVWVRDPMRQCQPIALYQLALLHSQLGQHDDAAAVLRRFDGLRYRIAPQVWDRARLAVTGPSEPPAKKNGTAAPVRLYGAAVPLQLARRLRQAFAPGAAYWAENDYGKRGYFSWYHPLPPLPPPPGHQQARPREDAGVTNAVEQLIHLLRPLVEQHKQRPGAKLCGAEWWVHSRAAGFSGDLGHQLHFDTDETLVERTGGGEVRCPAASRCATRRIDSFRNYCRIENFSNNYEYCCCAKLLWVGAV
eukprot:SAG22_NODE_258_length_13522_cov_6.989496_4_plen_436_part_00